MWLPFQNKWKVTKTSLSHFLTFLIKTSKKPDHPLNIYSLISCEQTLASCHITNHYFQRNVGEAWLSIVRWLTRHNLPSAMYSLDGSFRHAWYSQPFDYFRSYRFSYFLWGAWKNFVCHNANVFTTCKNIGINFLVGGNFVTCTI